MNIKPLLTSDQAQLIGEPYNFSLYEAKGQSVEFSGFTAAEMLASFTERCESYEGSEIQNTTEGEDGEDTFICWSKNGSIMAVLSQYAKMANYAV